MTIQLEEINEKVVAKEGRLKRYQERLQQYRQNRTFQNNERKFNLLVGGDGTKTHQQADARKRNNFVVKYGNQENIAKKLNRKAAWVKGYRFRRRTKSENTHRFTQNNTKKISNWKTSSHDGIHGCLFKKSTSIHDRLALEMNRCLQEADVPEWMTKRKRPRWSKKTTSKELPQTPTHPYMPTYNVEDTNCTYKGRNLRLANKPRIVPQGTERMQQRIQRHRRATLYWSSMGARRDGKI